MSESRTSSRMVESTTQYINDLFENTSKIQVVRVDLSYLKDHADQASLEDINNDLTHLLNNRRTKPSIFKNMVGYIAKREYTDEKGPHIHGLFFFDGHKISKDAHKGDQLGEYWSNEITKGKGIHHNCNREKMKYSDCALGMIDHTDQAKRTILNDKAIGYLCKVDQSIDPIKQSGYERSFTRGISPRRTSSAGRPRLNDQTDCTKMDKS